MHKSSWPDSAIGIGAHEPVHVSPMFAEMREEPAAPVPLAAIEHLGAPLAVNAPTGKFTVSVTWLPEPVKVAFNVPVAVFVPAAMPGLPEVAPPITMVPVRPFPFGLATQFTPKSVGPCCHCPCHVPTRLAIAGDVVEEGAVGKMPLENVLLVAGVLHPQTVDNNASTPSDTNITRIVIPWNINGSGRNAAEF
jgi:hypothetical protein